jgi:UDP-N-acetylmuramoyl-L-alanyl-D-glutamate--2,6-diaminopimelate ligase
MTSLLSIYHYALAFLGRVFFGNPSKDLYVVGVTGTKGKSTTIELMSFVMETAGEKTAVLSTVRRKVGDVNVLHDGNTMPGRFAIQRFLREAVGAGCRYAFIEVTSQGITQHRHRFIDWDVAVVTNLAPEHIEAHGSFEQYAQAKVSFFRSLAWSRKKEKRFFVWEDDNLGDFRLAAEDVSGGRLSVVGNRDVLDLVRSNPFFDAGFNRENAALAVALSRSGGVSDTEIWVALEKFGGVPGRLEFVQKNPFSVVVDYAHTPDSLRSLYSFLRESMVSRNEGGKMVCVLGAAGGGRDAWKRPVMGKVAGEFCDTIILADEDPYDEDPGGILEDISRGIAEQARVIKIGDRRKAIGKAISMAGPGDVVALSGKGSQQGIAVEGGKKIPWNEAAVARGVLGELET